MLWFERQVVASLAADLDDTRRLAVEAYVDGALASMPEYQRAGVMAESLVLGAWALGRRRLDPAWWRAPKARLESLASSRIGIVRQYLRLLRSLVLLARHEPSPRSA